MYNALDASFRHTCYRDAGDFLNDRASNLAFSSKTSNQPIRQTEMMVISICELLWTWLSKWLAPMRRWLFQKTLWVCSHSPCQHFRCMALVAAPQQCCKKDNWAVEGSYRFRNLLLFFFFPIWLVLRKADSPQSDSVKRNNPYVVKY